MSDKNSELDRAFIERQRERLEALRAQLSAMEEDTEAEGRALRDEYAGEPRDSGDEGANMAQREIDAALSDEDERRLRAIRRALDKIKEGTYGRSDASGKPIPKGRLEAMPEALYTIEEESRREGG